MRTLASCHIPHSFEEFSGGHQWSYWQQPLIEKMLFVEDVVGQRNSPLP